jgi:hypothetical protein
VPSWESISATGAIDRYRLVESPGAALAIALRRSGEHIPGPTSAGWFYVYTVSAPAVSEQWRLTTFAQSPLAEPATGQTCVGCVKIATK